jgi:hypothetical protein
MNRVRVPSAEYLAVVAGAVAVALAYLWRSRFGIDLADEGYFVDMATRVMRGELPYRDFDTFYTPAIFYTYAAVFSAFGVSISAARMVMIGVRIACGVLLYGLARRVTNRSFAVLPPLGMILADLGVESHPAWPALLGTLLMLEMIVRHQRKSADATAGVWLCVAGACAAIAFAFKQNVGAFAILAGAGYVVLRPHTDTSVALVVVRASYVACVAIAVRTVFDAGFDTLLASVLWLPLVCTLVLLLIWSVDWRRTAYRDDMFGGVRALACDATWFGAGVAVVTLAWLGPLVLALGSSTPFGLFLGAVNRGALDFGLEAPPSGLPALGLVAIWLPVVLAASLRRTWRSFGAQFAAAGAASLCIPLIPLRMVALDPLSADGAGPPGLSWADLRFGSLFLYLGALAAWSGLVFLMARRGVRDQRPPLVAWYLLVGTLANLALYPRADRVHALYAGTPLLVVGAWALWQAHHYLTPAVPRVGRTVIFGALLIVPVTALLPYAYWQTGTLLHPARAHAAPRFVPLGVDRADVLVQPPMSEDVPEAVRFVQSRTPPGAPLFAYPVDPLLNVLADRPNPTRFDHFMPGALTPADMQQVVATLEDKRPQYVIWDHGAVVFWETDHPNRPLSDYIWRCYRQVATFHLLLILERTDC